MKMEWKTCFRIGLSLFLLYLCILYWPMVTHVFYLLYGASVPLWLGCVIAYLLNILMSFYEKHYFPKKNHKNAVRRSRRLVCMLAAILTLIAVVVLVIGLVLPQFISCIQLLFAQIPPIIDSILNNDMIAKWLPENLEASLSSIDWQSTFSKIVTYISSGLGDVMGFTVNAVSAVFSTVVTLFLGIIFAIYLLMGKERLHAQLLRVMKTYLKPAWRDKIFYISSVCNDCFKNYIVGQCTEAVILGSLCAIGMLLLGLPYATMIGALVGLTALIPIAGAYIGAVVGALMILTISPLKALIFIVFLVILQQVEGNLIYPRVVGSSVGLPGLWVLTAITVGGGLSGIFGMLVGVPITAVCYRILKEDVTMREKQTVEVNKKQ